MSLLAEPVFTHADLRAAEKQQLRFLLEQQHSAPQPPSSLYSSYASYAPSFPIISLADDWQSNASPLPPPAAAAADPASSASADDYFSSYLLGDEAGAAGKHAAPSAGYSHYSVTSDYYHSSHPLPSPASPASPSYSDKLPSYDAHVAPSGHKRPLHSAAADELPPTKRLTVELPSHAPHKKADKLAGGGPLLQAQYPLLSSELVDGFFASNVNVGSGVMGGLDDSELGLGFTSISRQATDASATDKVQAAAEPLLPAAQLLPSLQLESQTSAQSQASSASSSAASVPFQPSSLSSVLSTLSSSASSPLDNPSSLSNLTNRLLPANTRGEGQRRMKRRLTDKQRRAKIKDGLEQLRSLVALHGNASSDQASIVNSSVDLVTQLVNERDDLKRELRHASDERTDIEREQQMAADKQRLAASVAPAADKQQAASPDLSVLLHHLSNILQPVLGPAGGTAAPAADSAVQAAPAGPAAAGGGLEHLVLSQYFLHTLKLLTNLPRNQ